MAPTLLSLHLLIALLIVISLNLAQAGPSASHKLFAEEKGSSKSVLASRTDSGIGTHSYRCILVPTIILYLERMMLTCTGDSVKWTDWTSGDGTKDGKDADGISYIKTLIDAYTADYPKSDDRVGIFWAGGSTTEDDFGNVHEFIEFYTARKGKMFTDVFGIDNMTSMGLSASNKNNLWWRAINRASKSFAASTYGGTAYVYMNPNNCRNLFSPSSQNPQDSDPDHGGQATNGEIWYYAELPALMRNLNVNKIVTFYKTKRETGKSPRFVQTTQWDVTVNTDKPRDILPDIAMDAAPIVLPQAADRPPLKRDTLPGNGVSSIGYQKGLFDVKTTSISGLTADSVTVCTATSASAVITTTVPIWSCSSCPTPYNAILVSPVSVAGSAGIPSPPSGYKPLSAGRDLKATPISLPTAPTNSVRPNVTNSYGETYRYPSPSITSQPWGRFPSSSASIASAGHPASSVGQSSYYPSVSSSRSSDPTGGLTVGLKSTLPSSRIGVSTSPFQSSFFTSKRLGTVSGSVSGPLSQKSIIPTNSTRMALIRGGNASQSQSSSSFSAPKISSMSSSLSISPGKSINSSVTDIGGGQPSTLGVTSGSSGFKSSSTGSADSQTIPPMKSAPALAVVPTGTQASSSAGALSSNIVVIAPIWQGFIDHPTKDKGDDLINKIRGIKSLAKDFEDEVGPPPSGDEKDCLVNTNLITDIFNAAKCLTDNLDKAETDIEAAVEDNFDDLTDVKNELENVRTLEKALENDTEKDDDNQSNSMSQSSPSSAQSSSQSTSSSLSSCTAMQTASDCSAICSGVITATGGNTAYPSQGCSTTCFSTFSACRASNSMTTVSTVASGAVCSWGGATSIPAAPAPVGPFVTAWFDYGISCAGSNCGDFATGSNVSVTASVSGWSSAISTHSSNSAVATTSPVSSSTATSSPSSTSASPPPPPPPSSTTPPLPPPPPPPSSSTPPPPPPPPPPSPSPTKLVYPPEFQFGVFAGPG